MRATETDWTDGELVDRLVAGDRRAHELFHQRHGRLIYHCIRARAPAQDADDLFQSFFERLLRQEWHALRLWRRGSSLPVYLAAVVRNFVTDFHRARHHRERPAGMAADLEPLLDGAAAPASAGAQQRELRRLGIRAWAGLEPRDRELVCGKLHRDLDNPVLADRLALSAGALRTALSRAQARFLARLRETAPEFFAEGA
ncbi:MAG: sigma-70 family RNA polymerase sigma factor [Reyranellaceae bacterium]